MGCDMHDVILVTFCMCHMFSTPWRTQILEPRFFNAIANASREPGHLTAISRELKSIPEPQNIISIYLGPVWLVADVVDAVAHTDLGAAFFQRDRKRVS